MPMSNEITIISSLGIMILMLLSNFNMGGVIGRGLSMFFFGVFGFSQYLMPVVFFMIVMMLTANDYSPLSIKKSVSLMALMLILSACVQLAHSDRIIPFYDLFTMSTKDHYMGGVLGGGIALGLRTGFGRIGAVIVLVCVALLSMIMLTQRSFVGFFRKIGKGISAYMERAKERRREERIRREEEEEDTSVIDLEDPAGRKASNVKMKTGRRKAAVKSRAKKVEDKVRKIREEMDRTRRDEKERKPSPDVEVPLFTSSDEVGRKDNVQELHPQAFPFTPEEGKISPFEGELDFSAFTFGKSPDEIPDRTPELMKTLEEQKRDRESYVPPHRSKGSFITDPPEELTALTAESSAGPDLPFEEEEDDFFDEENIVIDIDDIDEETLETDMDDEDEDMEMEEDEAEAFHVIEEAPEEEDPDPAEAIAMSTAPVKAKRNKHDPAEGEDIRINRAAKPRPAEDKKADKKKADTPYVFPPMTLLIPGEQGIEPEKDSSLRETAVKLQQTLDSFGVRVKITDISCGPAVTRYELFPEQGTKVSKIVSLADDIKLNLAAADIRIEAPIPGKAAIGIEVPNKNIQTVHFRDLIDNRLFRSLKSELSFAVGKDIGGKIVMADLAKMPHLLVAGTTGSGKSVWVNTLIMSIIYRAEPEQVRFIMIDPKMVELNVYNGIPHLLIPVVTDAKKASGALNWAVSEMTNRYKRFAETGVRNISGYNKKVEELTKAGQNESGEIKKMPKIVIIIDELADLMMVAKSEVEDAIVRLCQLARAAGIHMVIATQRPSVDVITGLIKANVPSRIALSVSSGTDSRTIIDMNGAEKLLGNGDMLFYPSGYQKPARIQGGYISDEEIADITEFLKKNEPMVTYDSSVSEKIEGKLAAGVSTQERDEYFEAAARFIMEKDKATIGMLQRMFKIGFNRAARIIDQLAEAGIVGPEEGTKPRKILMSPEELEVYLEEMA